MKLKSFETFFFYRSFVDFVKIGVFHYGHWVTLITVLIAGIGGTSLFALGES